MVTLLCVTCVMVMLLYMTCVMVTLSTRVFWVLISDACLHELLTVVQLSAEREFDFL